MKGGQDNDDNGGTGDNGHWLHSKPPEGDWIGFRKRRGTGTSEISRGLDCLVSQYSYNTPIILINVYELLPI